MRHFAMPAIALSLLAAGCQQAGEAPSAEETVEAAAQAGPAPMGDPADNPDMTRFAAEVDADGNGEMSRAEWEAKGLPNSSFNMFEKGRGFVTLEDYQVNAAPPGIDMDGDGFVTADEFVAFDKQMADQMGPPPPPQQD